MQLAPALGARKRARVVEVVRFIRGRTAVQYKSMARQFKDRI